MVDLPDEMLMAYADGALDESERRKVEAIVAADTELQRRLMPYQVTRTALQSLISEALTSPVPDRLVATVMTAPIGNGLALQQHAPRAEPFFTRLRAALFPEMPAFAGAMALAASVAAIASLGFMGARLMQQATSGTPNLAINEGEALATGPLKLALDTTPSMQDFEQGSVRVRPVQTFRDVAGNICRQYTMARTGVDEVSGFACRKNSGSWSIAFHAPSALAGGTPTATRGADQTQDEGTFRPVAGEGEPSETAVDTAINKVKARNGLVEKKEEAALIAERWPQK